MGHTFKHFVKSRRQLFNTRAPYCQQQLLTFDSYNNIDYTIDCVEIQIRFLEKQTLTILDRISDIVPSKASSVIDWRSVPVISISFSLGPNAPRIWSVSDGSKILVESFLSDAKPETTDPNRNLYFSMDGQLCKIRFVNEDVKIS